MTETYIRENGEIVTWMSKTKGRGGARHKKLQELKDTVSFLKDKGFLSEEYRANNNLGNYRCSTINHGSGKFRRKN